MKFYLTLVVLVLCLLLIDAKPGGKKGKKGKKDKGHRRGHERPGGQHGGPGPGGPGPDYGRPDPGHGGPDPGRGDPGRGGYDPGRPDPGTDNGRGGRGRPGNRDPRCENLQCEKPTRDTYVCGTDGESYRSECHLIRDICKGKIAGDVQVAFQGRCQHPAEAGEPYPGPGRYTPGHHRRGPGGKTPHGHHGHHHGPGGRTPGHHGPGGRTRGHKHPGGRTPGGGKYPPGGRTPGGGHGRYPDWWWNLPRECWDWIPEDPMMTTTMAPESSVPDFDGPVCTATCPIDTPEYPIVGVCGTNGRDYESACVLELVACVTNDSELTVAREGRCL